MTDLNGSTSLKLNVIPQTMNSGAALRTCLDLSFEISRNEANDDVMKSNLESPLNEDWAPWDGNMPNKINNNLHIKHENQQGESHRKENEDVIGGRVKYTVTVLIQNELSTMGETSLYNLSRTSFYNVQGGILSFMYNVVEQVVLELLRNDTIRETLNARVTKYFNNDAAANSLSKRWLTSITFMSPIATFVKRKADTAVEDKKCSAAFGSQ